MTWVPSPTGSGLLVRDDGTDVATRGALNFIAGTGISLTVSDDSANDEVEVTVAATGSSGALVGASAYRSSTNQTGISSNTAISFNAESWDTDGYHDNATNPSRLTVPAGKGGKHLVSGIVSMLNIGAGEVFIQLNVNGALAAVLYRDDPPVSWDVSFSKQLDLTAGDYVEVVVSCASSSMDVRAGAAWTAVDIVRLG